MTLDSLTVGVRHGLQSDHSFISLQAFEGLLLVLGRDLKR